MNGECRPQVSGAQEIAENRRPIRSGVKFDDELRSPLAKNTKHASYRLLLHALNVDLDSVNAGLIAVDTGPQLIQSDDAESCCKTSLWKVRGHTAIKRGFDDAQRLIPAQRDRDDRKLAQSVAFPGVVEVGGGRKDGFEGENPSGTADMPAKCKCGISVMCAHIEPSLTGPDVGSDPSQQGCLGRAENGGGIVVPRRHDAQ